MKKINRILIGAVCAVQSAVGMGVAVGQGTGPLPGAASNPSATGYVHITFPDAKGNFPPGASAQVHGAMIKGAYLGMSVTAADPTLQAQLKLPEGVGLVVGSLDEKGPAKEAGVQEHDIIYKIGDQIAVNPRQFGIVVRTHKAGEKVELTVIREAQQIHLTATLSEKEQPADSWNVLEGQPMVFPSLESPGAAAMGTLTLLNAALNGDGKGVAQAPMTVQLQMQPKTVKATYLGVYIVAADETLRSQLKLPEGEGVVVKSVDDAGPAHTAGMREHDIICKLDDQIVVDPEQFEVLVRMHKPGDKTELQVFREGESTKVAATLGEKELFPLSLLYWGANNPGQPTWSGSSPAYFNLTNPPGQK